MALTIARTGLLTKQFPLVTAAMSAYSYDEGLASLYKFETPFDEEVSGAIRQGNTLWVPRESVPYAIPPQDFRTYPTLPAINCTVEWRQEQERLCKQSLAFLKAGRSHIFEAPTGWGKTIAGGWIGAEMKTPVMIVVTKEDLMHQWYDSLVGILKVPVAQIGRVQQDECDFEGKRFVLGMVQSLIIPDRYPKALYEAFGLLILDEVHQMAADCFVRACQKFYAKYRLGFSATPNRKDGKTKLLHWHIGPTMVKGSVIAMKPKVLVRQTGWKIPRKKTLVENEWVMVPIPHGPGRMMLVYKAMTSNDVRNMEIVNFVLQSYKKGRVTLVMSDLRERHLDRLFQMLTNEGVAGQDIGYYVGGMTKHELELTKKRQVVLATYKMCSTGTNVPKWDTMVMATPRADVKQSIGRVLRAVDGKSQPVILDLVDWDAIFQSFHLARLKQYYEVGAEVVKMG